MTRHYKALRVANELPTDLELQELNSFEIFSEAGRLALLIGHDDDPLTFPECEREGYPAGGVADEWIGRTDSRERRTAPLHLSCQSARDYGL